MPSVDAKLPVDTNTPIPASVVRAAAAAEAAHKAAYTPEPAPVVPVVEPVVPPAPVVEQTPKPVTFKEIPEAGQAGSWEHRYLAMKGRYDQTQQTVGQMQEQMSQLGDELVRTQQLIRTPAQDRPLPSATATSTAPRHLTQADLETYGPELLDMVQRAAREAVGPDLTNLDQRTKQVSSRVQQSASAVLHQDLTTAVPNWQEINLSQRFKSWCSLPDVYSGKVRGKLLQEAYQAASAPRVIAFFKGFLTEEQATGQIPAPQPEPVLPDPPRQAATTLELLASPGRAKPASGQVPGDTAEKPILTRAQISGFYNLVRQGHYAGRDADKAKDEAMIFAAQRDGRVR